MFMFILMVINHIHRKLAKVGAQNEQQASENRVLAAFDQLLDLLSGFESLSGRDCERIANDLSTLRTVFASSSPAINSLSLEAALITLMTVTLPLLLCLKQPMTRWPQARSLMACALDCRMREDGDPAAVSYRLEQFTAQTLRDWEQSAGVPSGKMRRMVQGGLESCNPCATLPGAA